jgi:hypothetical protein
MIWNGTIETGSGIATSRCVWPEPGWQPGTLNLRGKPIHNQIRWHYPAGWAVEWWMPIVLPAVLITKNAIEPVIAGINTEDNTIELAAREHLRTKHGLKDGDRVLLHINKWYLT